MKKFESEISPECAKFILPRRDLGSYRHFGWALIGMGLFGVAFMLVWISAPLMGAIQMIAGQPAMAVFLAGFASFGLFGLYHSLRLFMLGAFTALNRTQCVVEIRGEWLYSNELLGPFTWKRKCSIDKIRQFSIERAISDQGENGEESPISTVMGSNLLGIKAIGVKERGFLIAPAYTQEIVEPLADELARRVQRERVNLISSDEGSSVEKLAGQPVDDLQSIPVIDQVSGNSISTPIKPPQSKITVHSRDDSLSYEIPPAGLFRGSKGLFAFSLIWLGIVSLVSWGMIAGLISDPKGIWTTIGMLAFISLFWGVGIGTLVAAINMGRRSVMIGVLGDQLFIERRSIFGNKWIDLDRAQILRISVGPSGMKVNDVPVVELQIHTADGKKQGLLSQLDHDELRWLASELQNALEISTEQKVDHWTSAVDDAGNLLAPPETKIEVETTSDGFRIHIPQLGYGSHSSLMATGAVLVALSIGTILFSCIKLGFLLFPIVFAICFMLTGISLIIGWLVYVTRRHEINATRTNLEIISEDRFTKKTTDLQTRNIQWVDIKPSGMKSNDVELMQLTVARKGASNLNLMIGRPQVEIAYVAAVINDRLLGNRSGDHHDAAGVDQDLVEQT